MCSWTTLNDLNPESVDRRCLDMLALSYHMNVATAICFQVNKEVHLVSVSEILLVPEPLRYTSRLIYKDFDIVLMNKCKSQVACNLVKSWTSD